jgi:hypothetical protein
MSVDDASTQEREAARNPRYVEVTGDSAAMHTWRRLSAEAFAPPEPESHFLQEERRDFESEVARALCEQFPDLKARASNLLNKVRLESEASAATQAGWQVILSDSFGGVVEPAPPPPPDGWFWWAQTQPTGNAGIKTEFLSDGLHFFGVINYGTCQ